MKKILLLLIGLHTLLGPLAASIYPVDLSYFICDLKYSEAGGVKICELQQGTISAFSGYDYLYNTKGYVQKKAAEIIAKWNKRIWYLKNDALNTLFREGLEARGAKAYNNMKELVADPEFQQVVALVPNDPSSIYDYQGIVIASPMSVGTLFKFKEKHPGILVLDAANYPYWIDKYKMTTLFTEEPELVQIKPIWKVYEKKYSQELLDAIHADFPGEAVVLKPRAGFKGSGVFIVYKNELESLLPVLLGPRKELFLSNDPDLKQWAFEADDLFIVEEFCESDRVEHEAWPGKLFDPTIRCVFVLSYHKGEIELEMIECHWNLPRYALSDVDKTLTERHKSWGYDGFFVRASDDVQAKIEKQLREAIPLLYKKMLMN